MNTKPVELVDGQGHPLGARVGDQPQGRERPTYLAQVNFQPLPATVEANSLKQILKIK